MSQLIPFGQTSTAISADIFANIFAGVQTLERKHIDRHNQLSIKGGKFHCIVDGETHTIKDEEGVAVNRLDVIVVGIPAGRSQIMFPKYDPESPAAPLCGSINGRTPDANFEKPFSSNCQTCEKRIKVMDEEGKERSPCQQTMYLAVVIQGQGDRIYKMRLPITAIFNRDSQTTDYKAWDQYVDFLRKNGVNHPAMVVTRISFESSAQYTRPVFKAVGHLTPEMLAGIAPAIHSPITKEITQGTVEQIGNPEDAPKQIAAPAKAPESVQTPAPAVQEPIEDMSTIKAASEARMKEEFEARIRAEVEAKMKAEMAAKATQEAPAPTEKPAKAAPKKEKLQVIDKDADLEAALADDSFWDGL